MKQDKATDPSWLRRLMDMETIGAVVTGADGRFIATNEEFLRIVGCERCDLVRGGLPQDSLRTPEVSEEPSRTTIMRRDGRRVSVVVSKAKLENNAEVRFVADLSAQEDAEEELSFRARMLDNVPAMVGYWDRDLRNRYANASYREWFGVPPAQIRGMHIRDVVGERLFAKDRPLIEAALRGEPQLFERDFIDPNGVSRSCQARYVPDVRDGEVRGVFVLITDVTPLKQAHAEVEAARVQLEEHVAERTATLERANADLRREVLEHEETLKALTRAKDDLHQSRKMEAVGRLSGGVAHDFNNLLTVIRGSCELLTRQMKRGEPPRVTVHHLLAIDLAAQRAEQLVRQLLAFSRRQVLKPRRIDVNERLRLIRPLVKRLIGDEIDVQLETRADRSTVLFDPTQLDQVILNLTANARDAMPNGGRLTLSTSNHLAGDEVDEVVVSVEDTGVGMSDDTIEHIFEPFFTTKALGRGTGLGLSMVHGIVSQSGGRILVRSQLGKGTRFEVRLQIEDGPAEQTEAPEGAVALGGDERVLVVDDEPMVRAFVATVLRDAGYSVIEATSRADAQQRLERERSGIDLLLTDVAMPQGSGPELAAWVREREPSVAVVYISGSNDLERLRVRVGSECTVLSKPFAPQDLLRCVRAACDARAEGFTGRPTFG